MIYPYESTAAFEAQVIRNDATLGHEQVRVDLRPVNLKVLSGLIHADCPDAERERAEMARRLAFGE